MEASGFFKYPRTVNVDFTKLDREALLKIIKTFGAVPSHAVTNLDLACVAARYFESHTPLEMDVVDKFSKRFCHMDSDAKKPRKGDSKAANQDILRVGEQAAAKISKSDNGSWILVNVLYYDASTDRYEVQDEDDASRVMKLDAADIRKLEDVSATIRRGDRVLAVFPETTSFYSGIVAKSVKPNLSANMGGSYNPPDIVIRFDDDEDDQGRPAARRVPARFVLPTVDYSNEEDSDDA